MPLDITVVPLYPNVPYAIGVPPVLRGGTFANPLIALASVELFGGLTHSLTSNKWGIFTPSGAAVLDHDSVATLEIRRESQIPSYPVENGGFGSYNKVQLPFSARILYTIGGSVQRKNAFIGALEAVQKSLELYAVVMPEFFYPFANVVAYQIVRRPDSGAGLLKVEIHLEEVRRTATATFSSSAQSQNGGDGTPYMLGSQPVDFPKEPSGSSPRSNGTVMAVAGSPLAKALDANPAATVVGPDGTVFGPVIQ